MVEPAFATTRRRLLAVTGVTLTSGCTALGVQQNETSGQNASANRTTAQEDRNCEPTIHLVDQGVVRDDSGFTTELFAEVVVENVGAAASGAVTITAGWLDSNGNFLGEDTATLPSLGAGETWQAYVQALGTEPESVDDVQITGEFETSVPRAPQGVSVAESSYLEEDDTVTGVATIDREESVSDVEAVAKLYAENGTVLGGGTAWEQELAAGTDWSFEIYVPRLPGDAPAPADHDVQLTARTHRILEQTDGNTSDTA